ncbi:ribonuclease H-like domain-containing protein [Tanacetum coccineum]
MPIWKDASYFSDATPRSVDEAQIQDKDGLDDENDATEKSHDDSSLKDNGTAVQQVNTGKPQKDDTGFIDSGCLRHMTGNIAYLSDFKEFMEILLKIPRKDNMYSFDMKNIILKESLTCLVAKATPDESMLWHKRLGYINFKNINKLVKDNLIEGYRKK